MKELPHTLVAIALIVGLLACRSFASTDLKRGDEAPPIVLRTADGGELETARLRDRTLVLLFAEASHRRTRLACRQITVALETPPLADEPVEWIVILARGGRAEAMIKDIGSAGRPPIIAHDVERIAFGAYEVKVVPTVVIVDRDGKVVHAMTGYSDRFGDVIFDAILFATGKMSLHRFEETLDPATVSSADERRSRAPIPTARSPAPQPRFEIASRAHPRSRGCVPTTRTCTPHPFAPPCRAIPRAPRRGPWAGRR